MAMQAGDDRQLTGKHWAIIGGVGVAAFAIVLALMFAGGGGNEQRDVTDACEAAVEVRLKAPSTADFDTTATESSPDRWTVSGTVDAENSFGAKVRSSFSCRVAWVPSSKEAVLQSADVG